MKTTKQYGEVTLNLTKKGGMPKNQIKEKYEETPQFLLQKHPCTKKVLSLALSYPVYP